MADLFQYLEDTPARPTVEFRVQNVPTDLDGAAGGTCTVTLTRPDGTAGPASGTVTHVSTGVYEITINGPTDPYWYDIEWAGTIGSKTVKYHTRVEWVSDFLFNVDDLRTYQPAGGAGTPFSDTVKYPDLKIQQTRTEVLGEFAKRLGFSPVRRYTYEIHSIRRSGSPVLLKRLFPGRVLDISVAGVAGTASNYFIDDDLTLLPVSGYFPGYWSTWGYGVVAVGYTHGWDSFTDDQGREAALMRASMKLLPGPSSTMNSYTSEAGSFTWDRAGTRNAAGDKVYFGVGAIAEWINEHRMPSVAVG